MTETAHTAQTIVDDLLDVAKAFGIVCPIVEIPASGLKLLVDLGFAAFFSDAAAVARQQAAAQTSGVAAASASAATTAIARTTKEAHRP